MKWIEIRTGDIVSTRSKTEVFLVVDHQINKNKIKIMFINLITGKEYNISREYWEDIHSQHNVIKRVTI